MRALLLFPFALSLALNTSCLRQTEFQCTADAQCGPTGSCQSVGASVGYCSFPDSECGLRFGESAGPYANQCVGMQPGKDDGGVTDGRPMPMIDAPPPAVCPANFVALPNDATNPNRYRKVPTANANWDTQRQACVGLSAKAFLAVPNDATELTGLFMLAGNAPFWVGIDDQATEGAYIQVTGGAAPFLPWATGQPDNAGGGQGEDCVLATGTTISDEKCGGGSSYAAVCECVP
jgi:Lectin C-type domain